MEPRGLYLMWNKSGKACSSGQDEGKFQDTISLVEEPSICLTDTDSGGSGFTATPGKGHSLDGSLDSSEQRGEAGRRNCVNMSCSLQKLCNRTSAHLQTL